jgi:predicted ATPase
LRASVDWSHALLSEPERVLFRRLAVFLGGFDLDAAQAVAGFGAVEHYQVLDQLALLVDKSLVLAENTGRRTRYRLLETVRQYALEKLGESGEADAVRSRHRDHYTALAALLDAPADRDYEQRLEQAETEHVDAPLHYERFSPPPVVDGIPFELELARSQRVLTVPADRSALGVTLDRDQATAHSCRQGFCLTRKG